MTNDEKMLVINDLISDIDCLEPLHEWTNDLNIFSLLKLDRAEIRHSNMLSWLLNPNEMHGLYDKLLKKFLIYSTKGTKIDIMNGLTPVDIDLMNLEDVIVYREKDNIDILIVSESNGLVLAIENKIGSTEHSNQLEKYKVGLLRDYPKDFHYVLIYLSPAGDESSDQDNWVSMSYEFVLEEITSLISIYKIPDKAKLYIEDYINAIRRNVVEDKEIIDICKKIYFKHQQAFDLIFENRPDVASRFSDYIYNYLLDIADKYDICVWDNHTKHYVRFTPNQLVKVCGHMGNGWVANQTNLIGFEFQTFEGYGVNLAVIIGPADSQFENYRQKLFDVAVKHNYKMKGKTLKNKWKTISSTNLVKDNNLDIKDEFLEDTIGIQIDNYMKNKLPTIISDLLEAF
ncbi:MAG: PD-(D/E)XK nuclease family protein [Clostridia bacterium]|nr:PD-(D/E)XK nuclease family protein [Clostridia bacterium]